MYNFFGKVIFPISMFFTKIIEIFWFRDISNIQDIRKYCFKYIYVPKSEKKKI